MSNDSFDDYQTDAMRTCNKPIGMEEQLCMAAMGISGEAGEVTDYLKKVCFHGHKLDKVKVVNELGDVLWYVAVLADFLGYNLSEVAEMNVAKLQKRYPNGFTSAASINRKEE